MSINENGSTRALGRRLRRRSAALAAGALLALCSEARGAPQAGAAPPTSVGSTSVSSTPPAPTSVGSPPAAPTSVGSTSVGSPPAAPTSVSSTPATSAAAPAAPRAAPQPELAPSAKRPLPDYDGRPDPPATAGDVLLWVPRVVFFPAYLVSEYLLRRPLGFITIAAERGNWIDELRNIFTFGPNHNIGIIPTALLDFGFRPSVGVYFFYDDLLVPGNELRLHAATGGIGWLRLTLADRIPLGDRAHLKIRGEAGMRPDWLFAGIGPRSLERDWAHYSARNLEGTATFHLDVGASSDFDAYTGLGAVVFDDICGERTVSERVEDGRYPLPPAFDTGYTAYRLGARLALDSRWPRPAPGHGVRLELFGEHAADVRRPLDRRWVRYGGVLGGFVDLAGHNRVLGLAIAASFSDPLAGEEVPFTELAQLGGDRPMRGFREGRLRGRSAAAATLEYRYPIWAFLDGSAQVAVGNVFGDHLRDFELDLLRLSFALAMRTSASRDHSFDLLLGAATETFDQGTHFNELRLLFGATRGF